MKPFEQAAKRAIQRHGQAVQYSRIVAGTYNIETQGVSAPTVSNYNLKAYPKHVIANQYNFPNLIGNNVIVFYFFAGDLVFQPKENDKITFNNEVFIVRNVKKHAAEGKVLLYKLAASLV